MESTTIKIGGRKRAPHAGKMTRRPTKKKSQRSKSDDKKRRASLFKRLSSKRAEQHMGSPLTPSRSFQGLNRSLSSGDSLPGSPTRAKSPKSPPLMRTWSPASDSAHSTATSSQSSSPTSSTPNSPASSQQFSRPSSLAGLKHNKLQTVKSPHRRKSVHNIPLSPLARTPSPSPMASSPTRSPSPLTMAQGQVGHYGISNMTQTYNPTSQSSPSPNQNLSSNNRPRTISRPKSCEPGSPLLRRALSPDRLHPNAAEKLHRKASSWHDKESRVEMRKSEQGKKGSQHLHRHSFSAEKLESHVAAKSALGGPEHRERRRGIVLEAWKPERRELKFDEDLSHETAAAPAEEEPPLHKSLKSQKSDGALEILAKPLDSSFDSPKRPGILKPASKLVRDRSIDKSVESLDSVKGTTPSTKSKASVQKDKKGQSDAKNVKDDKTKTVADKQEKKGSSENTTKDSQGGARPKVYDSGSTSVKSKGDKTDKSQEGGKLKVTEIAKKFQSTGKSENKPSKTDEPKGKGSKKNEDATASKSTASSAKSAPKKEQDNPKKDDKSTKDLKSESSGKELKVKDDKTSKRSSSVVRDEGSKTEEKNVKKEEGKKDSKKKEDKKNTDDKKDKKDGKAK